jgi:hypothetical protein
VTLWVVNVNTAQCRGLYLRCMICILFLYVQYVAVQMTVTVQTCIWKMSIEIVVENLEGVIRTNEQISNV